MQCTKCGKTFSSHTDGPEICWECYMKDINNYQTTKSTSNCYISLPHGFGKQEGWICPVCGRGVAPWTSFCPCQGSEMKITYGTSLGADGMNSMQDYYEQWTKQHNTNFDGELKS